MAHRPHSWQPAAAALLGTLALGPTPPAPAAPTAAAATPQIPAPVIPKRVFRVTDYGAKGDGTTKNTEAMQKAVDACEKAGGGTVVVPPGRYLTGPFTLTSRPSTSATNRSSASVRHKSSFG